MTRSLSASAGGFINCLAGKCGLGGAVALRLRELPGELLGFGELQLKCLT